MTFSRKCPIFMKNARRNPRKSVVNFGWSPCQDLKTITYVVFLIFTLGALQTQQCPLGKVIARNGSDSQQDCKGCPAGFTCTLTHNVPQPCERGYYCPFNKTRMPCRVGTYNNKTKATDEKFCLSCPAGYWCAKEGTVFFISNKYIITRNICLHWVR